MRLFFIFLLLSSFVFADINKGLKSKTYKSDTIGVLQPQATYIIESSFFPKVEQVYRPVWNVQDAHIKKQLSEWQRKLAENQSTINTISASCVDGSNSSLIFLQNQNEFLRQKIHELQNELMFYRR